MKLACDVGCNVCDGRVSTRVCFVTSLDVFKQSFAVFGLFVALYRHVGCDCRLLRHFEFHVVHEFRLNLLVQLLWELLQIYQRRGHEHGVCIRGVASGRFEKVELFGSSRRLRLGSRVQNLLFCRALEVRQLSPSALVALDAPHNLITHVIVLRLDHD